MAAAGGDTETQDLNFLLKLLGERGEDGQDLKEHTEHVSIFILSICQRSSTTDLTLTSLFDIMAAQQKI